MSIKSRNRAEQNQNQSSAVCPLNSQKKEIERNTVYCLCFCILLFIIAILEVIVLFQAKNIRETVALLAVEMIIAGAFIHCFIALIRRVDVLRVFKKIQVSTGQSVSVYCSKVSFLYKPVSKHFAAIMCVAIVDENGNKFYYVYPSKESPHELSNKFIKRQLLGKQIELHCYKNSCIIKMLRVW